MTAAARGALIAIWIVGIGVLAVYLEVENVRSGIRIRNLLIERDARVEKFRRLEMRFNLMASPDVLERSLPEEFRSGSEGPEASKEAKPRP